MPIAVEHVSRSRLETLDLDKAGFGREFSDHMLVADFHNGAWEPARIQPFGNMSLSPVCSGLHYGQSIFEGTKAFRAEDGRVTLFRLEDHLHRINRSAERLGMEKIPAELFLGGIRQLVALDKAWVPKAPYSQLYIRPLLFANAEILGVRAAEDFRFLVFTSPANAYYTAPLNVFVEAHEVRAVRGGVGNAKTAGNYARTMAKGKAVAQHGFNVVLWLDGVSRSYLNEFSTMNVFVVLGGTVITPPLDAGTILEGITRASAITILRDAGYAVEERDVSIEEVIQGAKNGALTELFGTGTAAVVSRAESFTYQGETYKLPPVEGFEVANTVQNTLRGIRTGALPDPYGWVEYVD